MLTPDAQITRRALMAASAAATTLTAFSGNQVLSQNATKIEDQDRFEIWDAHGHFTGLPGTPEQRVDQILAYADRMGVAESLNYPENTAGRLMQREFISLPAFWTVGQTIDFMRESDDLPHDFYEIFVVNPRQEPIGTVPSGGRKPSR